MPLHPYKHDQIYDHTDPVPFVGSQLDIFSMELLLAMRVGPSSGDRFQLVARVSSVEVKQDPLVAVASTPLTEESVPGVDTRNVSRWE